MLYLTYTVLLHIQTRRKTPAGIEQGSSRRACDGHTGSTVRSSLKSPQNVGIRHMALIKVGRILLFLRAFITVMLCTLWIVISGRDWFPQFPKRSFGKAFCKVMTST